MNGMFHALNSLFWFKSDIFNANKKFLLLSLKWAWALTGENMWVWGTNSVVPGRIGWILQVE